MSLPTDSAERKTYPMFTGLLKYFPDALAAISHLSYVSNEKHNPGEPLHWSKQKSADHADCVIRHLTDSLAHEGTEEEIEDATNAAWRALAHLQTLQEAMAAKKWSHAAATEQLRAVMKQQLQQQRIFDPCTRAFPMDPL